ncbi:hypothetical protein EVAR_5890_1 [Eumeta japonica]|uniref:Uncharacterized protein n=1 Tax=Eumeta variegata TaxID=151549 RepID=A0A4C1TF68_EUMVA|nr:hypothetical protein EVAR_5890_1 [Eumeta japonica]
MGRHRRRRNSFYPLSVQSMLVKLRALTVWASHPHKRAEQRVIENYECVSRYAADFGTPESAAWRFTGEACVYESAQ